MTAAARRVCYVTGTRADFGLMRAALRQIAAAPEFDLELVVTGMHLDAACGMTVKEVEAEGWPIRLRLPVPLWPATGATMARNIGTMLTAFTDDWAGQPPDIVLLLGDRGEMLAAAIAAQHLGIPVLHLHGGERSGTVDEPVRHAISRLAHFHGTATLASRDRLVRSGEDPACVRVTGAPGLDGLKELVRLDRHALCTDVGFDPLRPIALLVFHPVLDEAAQAGAGAELLVQALLEQQCQLVALMPNADAGSESIRQVLSSHRDRPGVALFTHLPRERFAEWMAACDFMVGNSSAGIIEAASFGTPVLDIGRRQFLRERGDNVIHSELAPDALRHALLGVRTMPRQAMSNPYGDGQAASRILDLLRHMPTAASLEPKHHVDPD